MRLLICAGGTGGGVYPAVAVLRALGKEAEPVLWVGSQGGLETDLVKRANIPYTAIPAGGVHLSGSDLLRLPVNILRLVRGYFAARKIIREFKPDVMLFTGGYVAVPVGLAGRRIPSLIFIPDIEPGMALKALVKVARKIAVTCDATFEFLPSGADVAVTGYPIRPELSAWEPAQARAFFHLDEELPVLLVLGGSKGTLSINRAIFSGLERLLQSCQIIHITGQNNWNQAQSAQSELPAAVASHYHPYPYLYDEIGAALSVADLAVSRSGASTMGEYPIFGLPAILVPYPYAWRYQKQNAAYLQGHGAAVIVPDEDLAEHLTDEALALLNSPQKLAEMRSAMLSLATPHAAETIAGLVRQMANRGGQA